MLGDVVKAFGKRPMWKIFFDIFKWRRKTIFEKLHAKRGSYDG